MNMNVKKTKDVGDIVPIDNNNKKTKKEVVNLDVREVKDRFKSVHSTGKFSGWILGIDQISTIPAQISIFESCKIWAYIWLDMSRTLSDLKHKVTHNVKWLKT